MSLVNFIILYLIGFIVTSFILFRSRAKQKEKNRIYDMPSLLHLWFLIMLWPLTLVLIVLFTFMFSNES